jgi:hypothetical protein
MRYLVTQDCEIDGVPHVRGDVVIIEHPAHAARLCSDHEGLLVPIYDERALDKPQHDRMQRKANKR